MVNSPYSRHHTLRPQQERAAYGEIPTPRLSDPEHELSCPWNELEDFILRLQANPPDLRVQPDLLRHFEEAGFGRLIGVKVEKLGHCAEQPEPSVPGRSKNLVLEFFDYRFLSMNKVIQGSITNFKAFTANPTAISEDFSYFKMY